LSQDFSVTNSGFVANMFTHFPGRRLGVTFTVSAAMALPFSSFPNVNSVLIVDDFQRPYLTVGDFVKTGLPLSIVCVFLIATFGYLLIKNIIV
jgi:di/tricarboxylate transporter